MKIFNFLSGLLTFFLIIFFVALPALALEGDILFFDDFNDGNLNGWTIESGNWYVINGQLAGSQSGRAYSGNINTGSSEWDNYRIESDVYAYQGVDQGIEFRYTSNDSYGINLRYGTGLYDTPQVKLWKTSNNQPVMVADTHSFPLRLNNWYHVTIEALNENIKMWINSTLILDFTDPGTAIKKGAISLGYWTGDISIANMRFDNVKVTALAPPPIPTPTPTPIPSKTPLILIPGIGASFNLGVLTDRDDTGWSWMRTAEGSWRQFIDSLEKAGYQKDKDYFIAFYDWRKTNDWTNPDPDAALPAKKYLVDAIDKAKTANPGINKVNVVAHSLGGLVIRSYVESSNYRGDINKAFLIGSPNAGSVFAYYTWEGAEIPPNLDPINKVGLNIMIRLLSFNFNEVPYLMIHNHIKSIKDLLPVGYNYIIKDETPLDWLNMQEVNNFLKNTSNPRDTAGIFANKGIGLMNITGTGQTTWEKIKVKDFLHQYLWKDGKPLGSAGIADGDNTVLTSSSNLPGVEQITITSNHANLPNVATSQIFNKLGISYTPSTLAGAPDKVMVAWVASPVTLTVKDSLGNEVGQSLVDPISGMKWVFVENPTGNYKIALTGTGSGDYHIGVDYYTESKTENVIKQGTAKSGVNLDYNLNFDPQAPQPLQLEPVDKIPPVTTVQLGGTTGNNDWYLSNVDASLSASDNEGGTGIEKIEYSLDNALWQIYTQPLNINTEGTTTIYYYSSDFVGNKEEVKKVDIKIDKTPPEAIIVFNPDLKEIEIKGEDNQSGIDNITENDGLVTITDKAGHSLRLWIKEKEKPHPDKISIESLSYDKQSPINLEENRLRVEFSWDKKDNILRELQQEARIKGDIKMTAHYNQKKNQTGITIKEDGAEKQKINIDDLVLLKLITNKGNLEVIY